MDPKSKLSQLDGLVADLIIGQNQLIEDVTALKDQVGQLNGQVGQLVDFQRESLDFQRESLDFQKRMSMQLGGIHDFLRQMSGEFRDIREEYKRFGEYETRLRTLESIVLKAS